MATSNDGRLAEQHEAYIQGWLTATGRAVMEEMFSIGFVAPRCYGVLYNFQKGSYARSRFDIDPEILAHDDTTQDIINLISSQEEMVSSTLLAVRFVGEGTVKVRGTDEWVNFLLITYETPLRGSKQFYTIDKLSMVGRGGKRRYRVNTMDYDPIISKGTDVPVLERMSHILRPNWSDKRSWVYN